MGSRLIAERVYAPAITFESAEALARWSRMVLNALADADIAEGAL
jgi:hypothetical protein